MRFSKTIGSVLAMLPLVGLLNLTGPSEALSATLEEELAAGGTADEHLAAARMYQNEAREFGTKAAQFEAAISKIGPYDDPKGFRRAALTMGAQENRYEAGQMQELYAAHLAQAQTLHGKIQPQ